MKKILYIFIVLFLVSSCKNETKHEQNQFESKGIINRHEIQDYATVDDLRNETVAPKPNDKVFVKGTESLYYYNSTSADADNGFDVIVQVSGLYRWLMIKDSDRDSTNEIQNLSEGYGIDLIQTGNDYTIVVDTTQVVTPYDLILLDTSLWVTDAHGVHSKSYRHVGIGEDANSSAILTVQGRADWNDGGRSVYIGDDAGISDDKSDNRNTGVGFRCMYSNTSGYYNSAYGMYALQHNTTGFSNMAIGFYSMQNNIDGHDNTAVGVDALRYGEHTSYNTIIGAKAGRPITNNFNTVIGGLAMLGISDGDVQANTIIGYQAGYTTTTDNSVMIGYRSGYYSQGDRNVFIGINSGYNNTESNRLYIENSSSNEPLIFGKFDSDTLRINGSLQIRDIMTLEPQASAPAAKNGIIFYADFTDATFTSKGYWVYEEGTWRKM